MAQVRHLPRAPATEALFDMRVSLPSDFDASIFREAHESLKAAYPQIEERREFVAELQIRAGLPEASTAASALLGYFFKSEDGKTIVQFRRNGFTFNRLQPYTSFDQLLPNALDAWEVYQRFVGSVTLTRIAVRYINHLRLRASRPLGEYLVRSPEPPVPDTWIPTRFLERFILHDPSKNATANVTRALEDIDRQDHYTILFDIDVYRSGSFLADRRTLGTLFLQLRDAKNEIFFGGLTEECLKHFL